MSLCLPEEAAKQLSRHVIDQVMESRQGRFLNGGKHRTKEFYVAVCHECHTEARNGAGGPAHASSATAAAEESEDEEVMLRVIAASLEDFDNSQAKAASLAEPAAEPTGHLDGVGDAEAAEAAAAAEVAAAIRLSEVEY